MCLRKGFEKWIESELRDDVDDASTKKKLPKFNTTGSNVFNPSRSFWGHNLCCATSFWGSLKVSGCEVALSHFCSTVGDLA